MPVNGIIIIILLILTALAFSFNYKKIENYFVFSPQKTLDCDPGDFHLKWRDVFINAPDGNILHGWIFPVDSNAPFILFCHGNAGNISHRLDNIRLLTEMKLNALIFDYSGYGRSSGKPSEEGLYLDALAAFDYLVNEEKIRPENIILFGRSLGAAAAIDVATKRNPKSLIIESGFLSTRDMARHMPAFSILSPFLPADYNNIRKIPLVSVPKLIIHGTRDDIVPFSMGKKLFESANSPKYFYPINGAGHNDTYAVGGKEYVDVFKNFVRGSSIDTL